MVYDVIQPGGNFANANMLPLSWVVLVGIQAAFFLGFTMGANDVANAFGSSVGAGVLTIKKACIIAAIFDVSGSLTLGAGVSSTVASKIIDVTIYEDQPGLFMLGMMSASVGATICVATATRMGFPISTTHAVIGAVAGFSFVETSDGIVWLNGKNGLAAIFLSWFVSPVFSGLFSALTYTIVKKSVLEIPDLDDAFLRQRRLSAGIIGWVGALITVFVLYDVTDGGDNQIEYHGTNVGGSLAALIVLGLVSYFFLLPYMERRLGRPVLQLGEDVRNYSTLLNNEAVAMPPQLRSHDAYGTESSTDEGLTKYSSETDDSKSPATIVVDELPDGVVYDPEVERRFMPLCVMTASFMAFTHGANDIANAAGPLVAIWSVYSSGEVDSKAEIYYWILFICCTGVVAGLLIWGEYVIMTVGHNITKMTPSKAVSIELSTATSVLIASFLKMPVSSTHCFIGAVIAVGLLNGQGRKAVKWSMISKIAASWVITVPFAGLVSAMVYAILRGTTSGTLPPPGYQMSFYNGTFPFNETSNCI